MKNVRAEQHKTCIFLIEEEFDSIIRQCFGEKANVCYELDGLTFSKDEETAIDTDELHRTLADYFEVGEVTSIHIDDCDVIGVWICFRGTAKELQGTERYTLSIKNGYLDISVSQDPNYPGIDIEYVDNDEASMSPQTRPRVLIECPKDTNILRALVWGDPKSEDYSDKIEFNIEG